MLRKKKPVDDALTTSEAPETPPSMPVQATPAPPLFPGLDPNGPPSAARTVTLIGGGGYDGEWLVPEPMPQSLSHGQAIYNLSDRAAGVYTYRVP